MPPTQVSPTRFITLWPRSSPGGPSDGPKRRRRAEMTVWASKTSEVSDVERAHAATRDGGREWSFRRARRWLTRAWQDFRGAERRMVSNKRSKRVNRWGILIADGELMMILLAHSLVEGRFQHRAPPSRGRASARERRMPLATPSTISYTPLALLSTAPSSPPPPRVSSVREVSITLRRPSDPKATLGTSRFLLPPPRLSSDPRAIHVLVRLVPSLNPAAPSLLPA